MLRGRAELGRAEWINLLPLRQSNRVHLSQAFSYSVHHYPSMRRSSSPCSPSLTSLYPVASHAHISSEVPMLTQIHLITLTPPPTHSQLPPHSRSFILRTNFHAPLPLFRRVFLPTRHHSRRAIAPFARGDGIHHARDMLAAAPPGGFVAGWAGAGEAHCGWVGAWGWAGSELM